MILSLVIPRVQFLARPSVALGMQQEVGMKLMFQAPVALTQSR